jgi:predicted transcriptional regulator
MTTSRGATKSSIATKNGLNFQRTSKHVDHLEKVGYLEKSLTIGRTLYVLTHKGYRFFSGLLAIRDDLIELYNNPPASPVPIENRVLATSQRLH